MTTVSFDALDTNRFQLHESVRWLDPDIGCTLVVSQPATDPGLWAEYAAGAEYSYRKHGVDSVLDVEALRSGADTIMLFAVLDDADHMVAGVRAIGPLRSAEDSHALLEWSGQPAQEAVRNMINDRVPFGVLEMKSAWTSGDPDRSHSLTNALARSGFHMMGLLDIQFCMATAAAYVLNRWRSSGGVVAGIPAAPYPDGRYQTKMMWWNRNDFVNYAKPEQVSKILIETQQVIQEVNLRSATGSRIFGGA
jgi:hypothetical protein